MLTAKDAYNRLKEVRKLEKEKSGKQLAELVEAELAKVEKDINAAIAMSKPSMVYAFISRERIIQMRVILSLEQFGYTVDFIEGSSSIVVGWADIIEL